MVLVDDSNETRKQEAMELISETSLPYTVIADKIGVSRQTIHRWKTQPEFADALEARRARRQHKPVESPYARRAERIEVLSDFIGRIIYVANCRAKLTYDDPEQDAEYKRQGGRSGLITAKPRALGGGDTTTDYVFDSSLMNQLQNALKHMAIETGEWQEQQESRTPGPPIVVKIEEADFGPK